jgi:hypothetical protein
MLFFISPDFIAPKADVSTGSCAWLFAYNPCQKISQPVSPSLRTPAFEASAKWWSTLEEIETSINLRNLDTKCYTLHRTRVWRHAFDGVG